MCTIKSCNFVTYQCKSLSCSKSLWSMSGLNVATTEKFSQDRLENAKILFLSLTLLEKKCWQRDALALPKHQALWWQQAAKCAFLALQIVAITAVFIDLLLKDVCHSFPDTDALFVECHLSCGLFFILRTVYLKNWGGWGGTSPYP